MGQKQEYKSSLRTKRWIQDAFLELLRAKPYDRITVTDIVTRADINRSTFYKHYPDVAGLIEAVENDACAGMFQVLEKFEYHTFFQDPTPVFSELFSFLDANAALYGAILNSTGSKLFMDKTRWKFEQYMLELGSVPGNIRFTASYRIRICYFAGGVVNLLTEWMTGRLNCTREELLAELSALLKGGGFGAPSMSG